MTSILTAPKDSARNALWRKFVFDRGGTDFGLQKEILSRCSEDIVFWVDTSLTVKNEKAPAGHRIIPMITWQRQEELLRWYCDHIDRCRPGAVPKTREQTATWSFMAVALWYWMFRPDTSGLLASRKAALVEGKDLGGLFQKIDYLYDSMFEWMKVSGFTTKRGSAGRTTMSFKHPSNHCTITGDTANDNVGRGLRYGYCFLDEFAFTDNQDSVQTAAGNASDCVFYVSTLNGINRFSDMCESGEFDTFVLDWQDNPLCSTGKYVCEAGCKAHKEGGQPHSKWYDIQCKNYGWDVQKIAQELDRNVVKSGSPVFDEMIVAAMIQHLQKTPVEFSFYSLQFIIPPEDHVNFKIYDAWLQDKNSWYEIACKWKVKAKKIDGGNLRVWKLPFVRGDEVYVLGGDVAKGLTEGDPSVAVILDITAGEIVAEHSSQLDADLAAIEWAKLTKWYGTSFRLPSGQFAEEDAWAGVEWNDHGITVNRILKKMGVFIQHYVSENTRKPKGTEYEGIVVHGQNRERMIGEYLVPAVRDCVNGLSAFCNPFIEFWQECRTFVMRRNKMQAAERKHDDRIFACIHAIYAATRRHGTWRTGKVTSSLASCAVETMEETPGRFVPAKSSSGVVVTNLWMQRQENVVYSTI